MTLKLEVRQRVNLIQNRRRWSIVSVIRHLRRWMAGGGGRKWRVENPSGLQR